MIINTKKIIAIGASVFTSVILLSGMSAFAVQVNPAAATATSTASSAQLAAGNAKTASSAQSAAGNAKTNPGLTQARINVCQKRQAAINNIMSRIDTRAQNQSTLFNDIAQKVEAFYTTSGKTVSNYSTLVANINSASQKTASDLSVLSSNSTFSCTLSNPRGAIDSFRSYLKTEISDLQNLRLQVKDLIVAVAKANNVAVTNQNNSGN